MIESKAERTHLLGLGPRAQATIAGMYAWATTVLPVAWGRGAGWLPKVAGIFALGSLVAALLFDRAGKYRFASFWAFVGLCALVWLLAPSMVLAGAFQGVRGLSGVLGWALYAVACAAPALSWRANRKPPIVDDEPPKEASLAPRSRLARSEQIIVGIGAIAALGLQGVGWSVPSPERAVLVRVTTLAAGVALVHTAATLATARHYERAAPARRRVERAALPLFILVALLLVGVFVPWLR